MADQTVPTKQPHSHSKVILTGAAVVLIGIATVAFMTRGNDRDNGENRENTTQNTTQNNGSSNSDSKKVDTNEPAIVLKNVGVASVNSSTVYSRFAVQDYSKSSMKGLYVFGDNLPGNRINPNFEFSSVKADTKVIAAMDGTITFIKEQAESKDSEVFLQTKENSIWIIGYDHLVDLKVKKGDTVKAGDVLGMPAVQNNGLYRFEMQINKEVGGVTTYHCPVSLLDPAVKASVEADLTTTLNAWEAVLKQDLYNQSSLSPMGCTKPVLEASEVVST